MRRLIAAVLFLVLLAGLAVVGMLAGRFLIVNHPQPADAILVINGDWDTRPDVGLALLRQGFAPRLILSTNFTRIYGQKLSQLAAAWAARQPEAAAISQCANYVDSTRDEAIAVRRCLGPNVHRVLLVTSDFHSRRAQAVFAHEIPGVAFSMASKPANTASDIRHWWRSREDAKTLFYEWTKLLWWGLVDRWR